MEKQTRPTAAGFQMSSPMRVDPMACVWACVSTTAAVMPFVFLWFMDAPLVVKVGFSFIALRSIGPPLVGLSAELRDYGKRVAELNEQEATLAAMRCQGSHVGNSTEYDEMASLGYLLQPGALGPVAQTGVASHQRRYGSSSSALSNAGRNRNGPWQCRVSHC